MQYLMYLCFSQERTQVHGGIKRAGLKILPMSSILYSVAFSITFTLSSWFSSLSQLVLSPISSQRNVPEPFLPTTSWGSRVACSSQYRFQPSTHAPVRSHLLSCAYPKSPHLLLNLYYYCYYYYCCCCYILNSCMHISQLLHTLTS